MATKPVILTVDDDPEVLRAIERDLRQQYGGLFRVLRADSGAAALEILKQVKLRNEPVALFKDNALFRSGLSQVLEPSDEGVRRKIYVVIDNYRIHFAKPVLALLATHADQIELVARPSYSPQFNPARRFWKHLRRKVTHTTFFQIIDRLLDAVTGFLRDMAACPQTVRSVAG